MHTYDVPEQALSEWLTDYPSVDGSYGHLLLEQTGESDGALVAAFKPYFESAHLDAREHFHRQIGIDLHPDPAAAGAHAEYPGCLDETTQSGLFGEVMAGMLTEHYNFVGDHQWTVPIFLFRHHEAVESYLFALARNPARVRAVHGRFGSDFVAVVLDDQGEVIRYLVGEAKWRRKLTRSVVDELLLGEKSNNDQGAVIRRGGIWDQLNVDTKIPHGLRQLQRLLQDGDPGGWAPTILSLDRALLVANGADLPRTNLVLISGNDAPSRGAKGTWVKPDQVPKEYRAGHDLQVIELILTKGEEFIEQLYGALWK